MSRPSVTSKLAMRRLSNHSMTRFTWRITSEPMSSPGRKRILLLAAIAVTPSRPEPGLAHAVLRLEGRDGPFLLQREAAVVEPIQEAVLAEGIELEMHLAAVGPGDRLLVEVDREARIG